MWCKIEACSLQTVGTAVAAPRFIHEVTGGRTEALSVEGRRSNYGFGIEKKVDVCRNVALTVPLVWCDVTERTGEGNVDWRNRADWRAECWLKEQSGLESGMLSEGTERTGEQNVDWRKRAADPVTGRKALLSVLLGIAFCLLTVCTVVLMQCNAAVLLEKPTGPQSRNSAHFWNRMFTATFTVTHRSVSVHSMHLHTI